MDQSKLILDLLDDLKMIRNQLKAIDEQRESLRLRQIGLLKQENETIMQINMAKSGQTPHDLRIKPEELG